MSKKLFVGNVPPTCKPYELQALFERYGKVTECDILSDYGFVHFDKPEDAGRAAESLNGWEFQGKVIRVEVSKNQFKTGKFRPTGPVPRRDREPAREPARDQRPGLPYHDSDPYRSPYRDPYRDPYPDSARGRPPPPPPPPPSYSSSRYYDERSRWYDYERRDPYYADRRPPSYHSRYSPPPPPREYAYDPPPGYRSRSRSPPYRRPEPPPLLPSRYYDESPYRDPPPRSPYPPPSSAGPLRRRTPPRPLRPLPSAYEGYHGGSM